MVNYLKPEEIKKHNTKKSCWLTIHNKVYDITQFLNSHPGGMEVLIDEGGKEATQAFEDIGHTDDAKEMMKEYLIGEIHPDHRVETDHLRAKKVEGPTLADPNAKNESMTTEFIGMGLVLAGIIYFMLYGQ